jgi:hypothetical protein
MNQLGLIEITEGLSTCKINLLSVSGKVDLESADIIRNLRRVLK